MQTKNQSKYQTKLKDPQWQKKRLDILSRDNFTCVLCKDTVTTLHVHHHEYKYGKEPWDYEDDNFATLCEHCHHEVTVEKYNIKLHPVVIYKDIDSYGNRVMFISHLLSGQILIRTYDEKNELFFEYCNLCDIFDDVINILNCRPQVNGYDMLNGIPQNLIK